MRLSAPVGVIFDMDGVLVDSEPLHKEAKVLALAELGIALPDDFYEGYKGSTDDTVMRVIAEAHPGTDAEALLKRKHEMFESLEHTLQGIPGAVDFVRWAKARYRIALATSATPRNRAAALGLLGLQDAFEAVVDADDFERPKPDPEVFQVAMRLLKLKPEQCWVLEDSLNGVKAAKAAGCVTGALTTTFSRELLEEAGADVVVTSFEELRNVLEGQ
jgi:HAD superfamily hydrolase (TIGR01509 family)